MIFVTVGTQLPFDRLIKTIDTWAGAQPYAEAFAQIGPAQYRPCHMPWAEFLDANECRRKTEQADVVVAHAGMGTILTSLELGRPVIVMPRLSALGEHRNDHQLDTAKKLLAQGRIFVAFDEKQLLEKLEYVNTLRAAERIPVQASDTLLSTLKLFVEGGDLSLPIRLDSPQVTELSNAADNHHVAGQQRVTSGGRLLPNGTAVRSSDRHSSAESPRATAVLSGAASDREALLSPSRFDLHDFKNDTTPAEVIRSSLVAIVLLAGRLRTTDLGRRIGRSRLDLPIDQNRSLLCYWRDEAGDLAKRWGCKHLETRVLLDTSSMTPTIPVGLSGSSISVERDRAEFRGTGGVLKDVCSRYDQDAWVLVANAAQLLFDPLHTIADQLANAGGEINLINDQQGIPNGLVLVRCGSLFSVPDVGFHDMKEQVVPSIANKRLVKVVQSRGRTSPPIHSLEEYTSALRHYHVRLSESSSEDFDERWQSKFAIGEQGSFIANSAVIHDSVVLEGGAVEQGAVVVRSVIGRGARVAQGQIVIDRIIY